MYIPTGAAKHTMSVLVESDCRGSTALAIGLYRDNGSSENLVNVYDVPATHTNAVGYRYVGCIQVPADETVAVMEKDVVTSILQDVYSMFGTDVVLSALEVAERLVAYGHIPINEVTIHHVYSRGEAVRLGYADDWDTQADTITRAVRERYGNAIPIDIQPVAMRHRSMTPPTRPSSPVDMELASFTPSGHAVLW